MSATSYPINVNGSQKSVSAKKVLITGGAGFVGSHTADALIERGHTIVIFDNLSPQVHAKGMPDYLSDDAEFVRGDVRDLESLKRAVLGVDVIYHFAAAVGVGQSMYQIADYTAVNNQGTANLLQAILDTGSSPEKLIIASSMSIYGEGEYFCEKCGEVAPPLRPASQLKRKQWEAICQNCGTRLVPLPTGESKPLHCSSIYALSKKDQEEMVLLFGRTYNIPAVALRYFNIYGTRQALSNPYTGVAAIFASRLMSGKPPIIFEDGKQMRDFVSVHDIVQANLLAMESNAADGMALNVGSGESVTVHDIARELGVAMDVKIPSELTGKYRAGDIRHCFADISQIREVLGYNPQVSLKQGLKELVGWLVSQETDDRVGEAMQRLEAHGLVA
jgi:dTDP-L-rhamnose 4-epimerase